MSEFSRLKPFGCTKQLRLFFSFVSFISLSFPAVIPLISLLLEVLDVIDFAKRPADVAVVRVYAFFAANFLLLRDRNVDAPFFHGALQIFVLEIGCLSRNKLYANALIVVVDEFHNFS